VAAGFSLCVKPVKPGHKTGTDHGFFDSVHPEDQKRGLSLID
jgi:hypothetical protein